MSITPFDWNRLVQNLEQNSEALRRIEAKIDALVRAQGQPPEPSAIKPPSDLPPTVKNVVARTQAPTQVHENIQDPGEELPKVADTAGVSTDEPSAAVGNTRTDSVTTIGKP